MKINHVLLENFRCFFSDTARRWRLPVRLLQPVQ